MKKNILYLCLACMTMGFAGCSTDPNDAVSKHVYGENENPYLRVDTEANIACTASFREGRIVPVTVSLKDYAEKIQTKMGMTVDDLLTAVDNGSVVFYNINPNRGSWDKTAPNYGTNGWGYNSDGKISSEEVAATVVLDKTSKSLVISVPEDAAAGLSITENVGFAINNGTDYDNYVRFNITISVSNPGLVIQNVTVPAGDYNAYLVDFSGSAKTAIETCMGMTVKDFNTAVQDTENGIALYMVKSDGSWNTESAYTANGLGYWLDYNYNVVSWGDGCFAFVETGDGGVNIGRYPGVASGATGKFHFVYANTNDTSKYVEFIVNATFE